jgi:hypothetical protein
MSKLVGKKAYIKVGNNCGIAILSKHIFQDKNEGKRKLTRAVKGVNDEKTRELTGRGEKVMKTKRA